MSTTEIFVVSGTPGVDTALGVYEGARVATGPTLNFAQRMVMSDQPPQAVYVDDTKGTVEELWGLMRACQVKRTPIFVGLFGPGLAAEADLRDAGIALAPGEARTGQSLAAWIAQQIGLKARASENGQTVIAIAGAKGGIGKTLTISLLAEGLSRRGLRVLIVDGDLSNSGIVPAFRIPSGFPSYLQAKSDGAGAWTTDNIRRYIYRHKRTQVAFLLGSEQTSDLHGDVTWQDWQHLMHAVAGLDEFDVVLVDTGPEFKRRPYSLQVLSMGGWAIFPTPPGRKERHGAYNALKFIEAHNTGDVNLLDHCLMLFMEPEKGIPVDAKSIMPKFAQQFPTSKTLGIMPRSPKQVAIADEEGDQYISPLDVSQWSPFSRAVYDLVDNVCQLTGIKAPLAKPSANIFQRMFASRRYRHASDLAQRPVVVNQ